MLYEGGYTDIHCHILPGLDDGAENLEQSKEMLLTAYEEGIRTIIVTPHNYASRRSSSVEKIEETTQQLNECMKKWGIPITLYNGNEIFYRNGIIELLEEKKILSLADSHYVLVEFEPYVEFSYLRDGLGELLRYGYFPILAHAERYDCLFRKKERIKELKNSGVYIQVNAASFLEGWKSEFRGRSRELLKQGVIDFVGTDAHSNRSRAPRIEKCALFLYRKLGDIKAKKILLENPKAIIEDRRI